MLDGQRDETSGVADVDGGPTIDSVAGVGCGAELAVECHQIGDEAVAVGLAVYRSRHANQGGAHASRGEREYGVRRSGAGSGGAIGVEDVGLGGDVIEDDRRARCGDEGLARPFEGVPDPSDEGDLVRDGLVEFGEVKGEGEMGDGVGLPRLGDDDVVVGHVAAHSGGAVRGDRRRGRLGAGQANDFVTMVDQFASEGGTDPPGRTGDEHAHERPFRSDVTWSHHYIA